MSTYLLKLRYISLAKLPNSVGMEPESVENNTNLGLNNESDNIDQNLHTVREKDKETSDVSMTEYDATINIPVHRKSYADILKA